MEYKKFQDIELSRLGFGAMRLKTLPDGKIDRPLATSLFDRALDGGINYIDTAVIYLGGDSEVFLGECLSRYNRQSYNLASKFTLGFSPDYRTMFEQQLKRLKTDYLDFYLMHGIGAKDAARYIDEGAVDYFLEQKQKGRIRYLGFSTHAPIDTLRYFVSHHQWDFAQMQLNYYDWIYGTAAQEYKVLEDNNIPVWVMEPVRGGCLSRLSPAGAQILHDAHPEWTLASWAFRFVRSLPQVQLILSGMNEMEQIDDNLKTFSDFAPFGEPERQLCFNAARAFHDQVHVPCTECRYCVDNCPSQLNIPEWIKLYNRSKIETDWVIGRFGPEVKSEGKPVDCIACGDCASRCPQSIDIPTYMAHLAQVMTRK